MGLNQLGQLFGGLTKKVKVTKDNIDDLEWKIKSRGIFYEIKPGMTITHISETPDGGEAVVFHDTGRAAIGYGADPEWGEIEKGRYIRLDSDPEIVIDLGHKVE